MSVCGQVSHMRIRIVTIGIRACSVRAMCIYKSKHNSIWVCAGACACEKLSDDFMIYYASMHSAIQNIRQNISQKCLKLVKGI